MKTKLCSIFTGGMIIILAASCHAPANPANPNTTQNSDSIRQDKTQVYIDTTEEATFKQHERALIKENNERIATLKEKMRNRKRVANNTYNEQLDTLNAENTRMETRLDKLNRETRSDWETFKYNFNRDMDTLGKSISRITEGKNNND